MKMYQTCDQKYHHHNTIIYKINEDISTTDLTVLSSRDSTTKLYFRIIIDSFFGQKRRVQGRCLHVNTRSAPILSSNISGIYTRMLNFTKILTVPYSSATWSTKFGSPENASHSPATPVTNFLRKTFGIIDILWREVLWPGLTDCIFSVQIQHWTLASISFLSFF